MPRFCCLWSLLPRGTQAGAGSDALWGQLAALSRTPCPESLLPPWLRSGPAPSKTWSLLFHRAQTLGVFTLLQTAMETPSRTAVSSEAVHRLNVVFFHLAVLIMSISLPCPSVFAVHPLILFSLAKVFYKNCVLYRTFGSFPFCMEK